MAPAHTDLRHPIRSGCDALGIGLSPRAVDKLAAFVTLLAKWNRVYNLTAVRQPGEMVVRHILDSLAILPWLPDGRLLDIGTGAGLPGLPLAIARPGLSLVLLDASAKKLRFVRQAVAELGLDNVQAENCRLQDYRPSQPFDAVISRAFSSLAALHAGATHLCAPGGVLLAMKGARPLAELTELEQQGLWPELIPLQVPGLAAERHLVRWRPGTE